MVKIDRRRSIIITLIIIVVAALATVFIFRAIYSDQTLEQPNAVEQPSSQTAETVTDLADDETVDNSDNSEDTPVQYEGSDPNNSTELDAILTYYGLQNQEYVVNISIAQYVSGNCTLQLGDFSTSTTIDQNAANSACSFHIDAAKLTSGLQNLIVEIKAGSLTGRVEETIDVNL